MFEKWSGQRDSNPRMMAWEAIALPLGDARSLMDFITVLCSHFAQQGNSHRKVKII
jgi:hypothetical protein